MKPSDFLTELSNEKLAKYKTAAAADASKADKEKDFARGDKRFSGIVKATKKQFDNDAKKDVTEEVESTVAENYEAFKKGVADSSAENNKRFRELVALRDKKDATKKKEPKKQGVAENVAGDVNSKKRYHFLYPHVPLDMHTDHEYNDLSDRDLQAVKSHQRELAYKLGKPGAEEQSDIASHIQINRARSQYDQEQAHRRKVLDAEKIKRQARDAKRQQGVAEGSETAADIDKKIEFHKQGQAAAQYKGSMNKMHAAKIRELEAKKQVLKQGVAEGSEFEDAYDKGYSDGYDGKGYNSPFPVGSDQDDEYEDGYSSGRLDYDKMNQDLDEQGVAEGWSQKYKSSINCSHPKGFSQKAHCAGKKKHNESIEMEMVCEDCGMCETHSDHENLDEACWKGYHKEGNKKMFGKTYPNCVKNEGVAEADIIGFRRSADAISKQKVWQSSAASDSKQDDKTFSYQGYTINFTPDKLNIYLGGDLVLSRKGNFANPTKMQLVAARGNIGKIIDDKRRAALIRSVIQKNKGIQGVAEEKCPHCNGPMVSEELINEKKDACYYKVKSRYKVWPSAYASGALVKCRNKGANNWGNGGKKNESSILEGIEQADESLHDWFNKEKWVRMDTKGNIKGPCAKEPGEGKPKCLPQAKAHSLGKKGRASAAARKRREDPNPDRSGKAINVNTKKTKG